MTIIIKFEYYLINNNVRLLLVQEKKYIYIYIYIYHRSTN